jgi:hypothetical protein
MIAFKQLLSSDVIVTPLEVNKAFTFSGSQLTQSTVGIDRFLGTLSTASIFNPISEPTTGYLSTQYQTLVYSSIKELYYSNYIGNLYGTPLNTASLIPNSVPILSNPNLPTTGVLVGTTPSPGLYDNYLQSTLTFPRYFPVDFYIPSGSNYGTGSYGIGIFQGYPVIATIGVISIPSRLYGDFIQPSSFIFTAPSGTIYDDGEGNLILSGSNTLCGNIFYGQGLAIITSGSVTTSSIPTDVINFVTASNVTCSFSSSLTIYENQYKCTIRENEFTYTLNPTLQTDQSGSLPDYTTGSYWSPYITTVGLYDETQNLLAIGKLAQPLPTSPTTDTTILINIDM